MGRRSNGKKACTIEGRYKNSQLTIHINGKVFDLKYHSAQDEFLYDPIKDVKSGASYAYISSCNGLCHSYYQ